MNYELKYENGQLIGTMAECMAEIKRLDLYHGEYSMFAVCCTYRG